MPKVSRKLSVIMAETVAILFQVSEINKTPKRLKQIITNL